MNPGCNSAFVALRRHVPALAALCGAFVLAGCVSSAGIAPQAQEMSAAEVGVPASAPATAVSDRWWEAFGDARLDKLVESAFAANPSLKVARDRIARAAAATSAAQANAGPRVDAELDLQRQRYTENGLIPPPIGGSVGNTGLFQLSGSWEIDFFGKNAAALGAALGTQRAAEADAQAARVLLAANVARSYFALGGLFEQRAVAERALAQRQEILALIRQRVEAGLDTNVELRQGEAAVPETARQIEVIDEQIAHTRHALAALAAQPAGALDALQPRLRTVQAVPLPADIPADLLGRRADIEAARQRVEAATQDVAYSKTLLYPNVNLIAFAGLSSLGVNRLLNAGSEQYGAGVAIHLPIFDAGRLRANVSAKTADLDAAVDSYNAVLIDAVRDAADQIASVRSIARQHTKQAEAQARSEQAYDLALQRFGAGLGTYLTVLSAELEVLAQRRRGADLKARELDSQVLLARALGGGYDAAAQNRFSNGADTVY
ncbi:MAG: efflux transporter outer membrane subunit [Burkholderiaceae bacterium]|nr:efflux transporter outer membrane subunit [Burkholderiaceae bacterium]